MDVNGEASWLQWAISSVLGFFALLYGGAIVKLYGSMENLRAKQELLSSNFREQFEKGDKTLWDKVSELQKMMEEDRRQAEKDRREIVEKMVTRIELREQIDRIIELLRKG